MVDEPYKFIGGVLCLDFCNTGENREDGYVGELLGSYHGLVAWALQAHLLTDDEALALQKSAAQEPPLAAAVYQDALALREALYRLFSALAGEREPNSADLAVLNAVLARSLPHRKIDRQQDGTFVWGWENTPAALDKMLWHVAVSAADLLTAPQPTRIRECANGHCSWLFLDESRNHSRRWCTMESCGNRVKVRRFRERT